MAGRYAGRPHVFALARLVPRFPRDNRRYRQYDAHARPVTISARRNEPPGHAVAAAAAAAAARTGQHNPPATNADRVLFSVLERPVPCSRDP